MPMLLDGLLPEVDAIMRRDEAGCPRAELLASSCWQTPPGARSSERDMIADMCANLDEFARADVRAPA
jgi:hypothetical protein